MNDLSSRATLPGRQSVLPRKRNCGNGNKSWFKPGVAQTTKHGMTNSMTYKTWSGMLSRCRTTSATGYENYGGRGIRVCDRWLDFNNFLEDMGEKPAGMSIDRINSNGDYEPGNCQWSTRKEQNRNQRRNVELTHEGRSQCISAWAEELGFEEATIRARLSRGWSVDMALSTPIRGHKEYKNARR